MLGIGWKKLKEFVRDLGIWAFVFSGIGTLLSNVATITVFWVLKVKSCWGKELHWPAEIFFVLFLPNNSDTCTAVN